jgi:O-succinylbenzoic acid--CoA ligase
VRAVDALAAGLRSGVNEGDGVLLRAYNQPSALLAWLALLQCGARVLPLNPQLPPSLLAELLPRSALCAGAERRSARPRLYAADAATARRGFDVAWREERLASMTLTSGSTGLPKAAVHSCRAHLASAEGVLAMIPLASDDDWLLSLPLFHVSGQGILWRWLLAGAPDGRRKQPLEQALRGCTHASLVPTQLWRLLNSEADVSLKAVLLAARRFRRADRTGARPGHSLLVRLWPDGVRLDGMRQRGGWRAGCRPAAAGARVKIVDGEVWLRADSMAAGYWRDGGVQPLVNEQGWFATRDRGEIRDGKLTLLGRMDNLFFSGGRDSAGRGGASTPGSSADSAGVYRAVRRCGVWPASGGGGGVRCAVRCRRAGGWAQDKLARFQQPVRWLTLPESLKTGGIKISRRALRDWVNALPGSQTS